MSTQIWNYAATTSSFKVVSDIEDLISLAKKTLFPRIALCDLDSTDLGYIEKHLNHEIWIPNTSIYIQGLGNEDLSSLVSRIPKSYASSPRIGSTYKIPNIGLYTNEQYTSKPIPSSVNRKLTLGLINYNEGLDIHRLIKTYLERLRVSNNWEVKISNTEDYTIDIAVHLINPRTPINVSPQVWNFVAHKIPSLVEVSLNYPRNSYVIPYIGTAPTGILKQLTCIRDRLHLLESNKNENLEGIVGLRHISHFISLIFN